MIEFVDVGKQYSGSADYVLKHIDLEIVEGEFLVLLGASGSGKTTLLKLINALEQPSDGTIYHKNQPLISLNLIELRRGIGYVIQETGLFPHYTVFENIATLMKLHKINEKLIEEQVANWMVRLGLDFESQKNKMPSQLSGGQAQRVGLARALVNSPELVLMDEPFSALDPQIRKSIRQDFKAIQQSEGTTVVMVTHDLLEAVSMADRICFIEDGEIQFLGSPLNFVLAANNKSVEKFIAADKFQAALAACKLKDIKAYQLFSDFSDRANLLDVLAQSSEVEQQQLMTVFYKWKAATYA